MDDLSSPITNQTAKQFLFPYSHTMKAYLFGNFEEQLSFNCLTDDEVIEVLNDINSCLGHPTKASFSNVDLKDDAGNANPANKDERPTDNSHLADISHVNRKVEFVGK